MRASRLWLAPLEKSDAWGSVILLSVVVFRELNGRCVPGTVSQSAEYAGRLLGQSVRWRLYEKAVGSTCWNDRFQLFLAVTIQTGRQRIHRKQGTRAVAVA